MKQQKLGFSPKMDAAALVAAAGDEREVVVKTTVTTTTEVAIKPKEVKPTIAKKKYAKSFTANTAANMNGPPKPQHKLVLSDYIARAMNGIGDHVFMYARSDSPLATKSSKLRGEIAELVAKRFTTNEHHWDITDAETSADVNGRDLSKGHETYDFGRRVEDGAVRAVEVKLARYVFDKHHQYWELQFKNVKTELHDELILVVEGLDGMHFFLWGGQNLSTAGKATEKEGGPIVVCSTRNEPDFGVASAQLMAKMKQRSTFLGSVLYTNAAYTDLFSKTVRSEAFYADSPLSLLSSSPRGDVCENLVRAVLADNLGHDVKDAEITKRVNGAPRGANQTKCDFKVDAERAEVKSGRVSWDKTRRGYKAQYKDVKCGEFERLYLCFEGPKGLHIFLHDRKNGYVKGTEANGGQIVMCAPSGKGAYTYPPQVEDFMLKQFKSYGSKYIASVAFSEGDAGRLIAAVGPSSAAAGPSSSAAAIDDE